MAVYFIRAIDTSFWKIGYTSDKGKDGIAITRSAIKRLESLQTGCPFDLELYHVIYKANLKVEKELHSIWSGRHVRGEWFMLSEFEVWESVNKYDTQCNKPPPETTTLNSRASLTPHDYAVRFLESSLKASERKIRELSAKCNDLTMKQLRLSKAHCEAMQFLPETKQEEIARKASRGQYLTSYIMVDGETVYLL